MSAEQKTKCTCDEPREVNAHRANGAPVVLWACPTHGNLFEDRESEITLTPLQQEVLLTILRENRAGRSPTTDDISWMVNRTVMSVERAMAVLVSLNFIQ